jgi:hypothetical protein
VRRRSGARLPAGIGWRTACLDRLPREGEPTRQQGSNATTMPQRTAELVTARTSAGCVSYRLYTAPEGITDAPRLIWSNRVHDDLRGTQGRRGGRSSGVWRMGIAWSNERRRSTNGHKAARLTRVESRACYGSEFFTPVSQGVSAGSVPPVSLLSSLW